MMSRVLVCGAGSIGRRHIANLREFGATVTAWRSRADLGDALAHEFGITVHSDLASAVASADAVVVATDTDRHLEPALAAARAGKALFIEKPISHSREGIDGFAALVREKRLVVEIGCQLRAHPCLRELHDRVRSGKDGPVHVVRAAVGQRLDAWRPGTDYRQSYSADAARGGGALMDLIHEIDLVLWLAGPVAQVEAVTAKLSDLAIAADDVACLTLTMRSGALAQIEMDMLSPVYRRSVEVVSRDAVHRHDDMDGGLMRSDATGSTAVKQTPPGHERNHLFRSHMEHFLKRLQDPTLPALCSLDDGIAALDVALAARRAAASRTAVTIDAR
jgi:predicted dehydrogenase